METGFISSRTIRIHKNDPSVVRKTDGLSNTSFLFQNARNKAIGHLFINLLNVYAAHFTIEGTLGQLQKGHQLARRMWHENNISQLNPRHFAIRYNINPPCPSNFCSDLNCNSVLLQLPPPHMQNNLDDSKVGCVGH